MKNAGRGAPARNRCRTPRRFPSPSSPTVPTKSTVPGSRTFAVSIARATASSTARPRQSSPMPGPWYTPFSRRTRTSVPSGNTVSRCAESITLGPLPVPGRSPMTFPSSSTRTLRSPSDSKRRRSSAARTASLNGGAGISQMEVCCSSVHALSARTRSSAARTVASAAAGRGAWAQAVAATSASERTDTETTAGLENERRITSALGTEGEVDGADEAECRPQVIEAQLLLHVHDREGREHGERDHFLQDLELRQGERGVADAVRRDL